MSTIFLQEADNQRKRKQSLKVAELLHDETPKPPSDHTPMETSPFLSTPSPSGSTSTSGSWSSDSEESAISAKANVSTISQEGRSESPVDDVSLNSSD